MADGDVAGGAAGGGAAASWVDAIPATESELIGHIKNAGWDKVDASTAALNAVKSWKAAEKHIGAPADQLVRWPKDASDQANLDIVRAKLGVPKDAKDYDFSAIKFSDGTDIDTGFADFMRSIAAKNYLPKDAAVAVTKELTGYLEKIEAAETTETTAKLIEAKAKLATNWGKNYDANMFVAQQAVKALGLDPETVASAEKLIGYDKIMEMFRSIGAKTGEDRFVTGDKGGAAQATSRDEAVAQKRDLLADAAWAKKYTDGDVAANRQMHALNVIIAGEGPPTR